MSKPWSERQREALIAFRQAIVSRAQRERAIAEGAQSRTRATEQYLVTEKARVESEQSGAQAEATTRVEQRRRKLQDLHEEKRAQIERDYHQTREKIVREYQATKAKQEAEFRESRWTTTTVYEADKRVAREQMNEAMNSCKAMLRKLLQQWRAGRKLIDSLEFLDDIPPLDPAEVVVKEEEDPWRRMQECADEAAEALNALQTMKSPHFINGRLPWLVVMAVWLFLAMPGVFGLFWAEENKLYWGIAALAPALVWVAGAWYIHRTREKVNDRIITLWLKLRHAAHSARQLRPICFRRAKKAYLAKKRQSFKRNRELLRSLVEQARVKLEQIRAVRNKANTKNEAAHNQRTAQHHLEATAELREVEAAFARDQQSARDRHAVELRLVESEYARQREENHQWHTRQWTSLLRDWKTACDQFVGICREVARDADQWFPPWNRPLSLPKALPQGLPIGAMRWTLDMFPDGVPEDPQLPRPDLSKLTYPALLPFPEQASLLFRAQDAARGIAVDALQTLLLRCWTAMPAGKMRCTIIDPVGRGENFSAFMHLADHDEKLVDYRIWTETGQIDERLTNLTLHMENVLQKYLRNQFETLADYNAQAGEVAEPFHFLVVAHFPVNFSEDAARRLVSLASAGARCGIYTFVMVDTKQPMPHGFNLADLENVCTCLYWQSGQDEGKFVWQDTDFGSFPLELDRPPSAERCTELLRYAGEEAVRSSKVEVPFDWIMPPRESWWTGDSAEGIRVPIGRFGAQGRQMLELGQGTSQHVLIAGKTGSGKSTLLHVLITQTAMIYSPREVELYLIDFKKGVEFKAYASLAMPHARVIAVESEREFGLSVLQRLDGELSKRGELYRAAGVNDLATYREHAARHPDLPHLPRLLLIVDEFQEFFIEDDKIAQEASLLLDRLVRQGRAFGMHVLLGSQTIGGAYSLARSTIDQMAVRIALQCSEADAHLILSRDNTEARLLSRPGEGIYNAMHGMLEGNHLFQVVWLDDSRRDDLLKEMRTDPFLSRSALRVEDFPAPIVFEGGVAADLAQNPLLERLRREPFKPATTWHAWLGDAVAIKDPTAAVFKKQSGSNVVLLGQQEEIAVGLMASSLISLGAAIDPKLGEPTIHLVIGQALDAATETLVTLLTEILPIRLWPQRELGALLNYLAGEIEQRGQIGAPPQFLFLYGLQRLRDLRRPEDDFGFSRKGQEKTPYLQFTHLLKEGPPVGIFTMLWCDTLVNLQRSIDRPTMREFDQRILMQMSAADSSTLMDSPIAAKLGPQRAIFFTEDQGKIEKFRPYTLPRLDWIKGIRARLMAV